MLKVPVFLVDTQQWMRNLAEAINQLIDGRSNAVGSFTLTANATSTVVTDLRFGTDSVPNYKPTTANAATEYGGGNMYISSRGKQTFTITHSNNAQTDRTFIYSIQG